MPISAGSSSAALPMSSRASSWVIVLALSPSAMVVNGFGTAACGPAEGAEGCFWRPCAGAGAPGMHSGATVSAAAGWGGIDASPGTNTANPVITHKARERILITITTPSSGHWLGERGRGTRGMQVRCIKAA